MASLPEELDFELEALRATYDDVGAESCTELRSASNASSSASSAQRPPAATAGIVAVSVPVVPRTDGGLHTAAASQEQYVAARLVLSVGPGYPTKPPAVQLVDAKGLGDERLARLQATLAAEAAALAGELSLGHLVETAMDLLTECNQPEGLCAFCLEPLLPAGAAAAAGGPADAPLPLLRLGCYHCYHVACFAPWWHWQQRQLAAREAQLREEYKSMAPLKMDEEGIRRAPTPCSGRASSDKSGEGAAGSESSKGSGAGSGSGSGGDAYVLACPACRAELLPASLAHLWEQLQAATADSWSNEGSARGGSRAGRAALQGLPAEQRQVLAAMQRRHAAVMKRQAACGGLVDATHSVSLSDLQQAAAAAAAEAEQQRQQLLLQQAAAAAAGAEAGGRAAGHGGQRSGRGPGGGGRHSEGAGSGRGRGRGQGQPPAVHAGRRGAAERSPQAQAASDQAAAATGAMAGLQLNGRDQWRRQQQQQQQKQQALEPQALQPQRQLQAPAPQELQREQQQQQQQRGPKQQQPKQPKQEAPAPQQQQRERLHRPSGRGSGGCGRHRAGARGRGGGRGAAPSAAGTAAVSTSAVPASGN